MHDTDATINSGYFGKVPTQGDFVSRGLPRALANTLDLWLREAVRASRQQMGREWLDAFLVAPVWRMALGPGVAGADAVVGVMMPSVDRIGRYFPLAIAAPLTGHAPSAHQIARLTSWFDAAESLALSTLDSGFSLARFNEETTGLDIPPSIPGMSRPSDLFGVSLWWRGANIDAAERFTGMPAPKDFGATFLQAPGPPHAAPAPGQTAPTILPPPARRRLLSADCAGASLKGTRSAALTDATAINDDHQAMSVVSGIGNHPRASAAVQVVADTLARIEHPFSMNDLAAEAKGKLGTANTLLRAFGAPTGEVFAASVVTLLVQASRYSVLWSGNARAYLLRDGMFARLTRDHVETRLPGILTRALGGGVQLTFDSVIGQVRDGDRFLLCSPGLPAAMEETEIAESLATATSARGAAVHLTQDALIAGAPLDVTALAVILSARGPGGPKDGH